MTDTQQAPAPTMDTLTKVYIRIRTKRAEMKASYEKEDADMEAQQAQIANAMKDQMQAVGLKSAKTEHGIVSLVTKTRYYAQDWEAMHRFIVDNDAPFLLEKRIAQTAMSAFLEENPGVVPPGLNTMSEVDVSVRKATK